MKAKKLQGSKIFLLDMDRKKEKKAKKPGQTILEGITGTFRGGLAVHGLS